MTFIAIGLSIINLILLIFFLIRFKQLFSTDKVIENTREKMDQMIRDINNNTKMDLDLVQQSSDRIKNFMEEADKKMVLFQEATQRLRDMIAVADKINRLSNQQSSLYQDFNKINQVKPAVKKNIQAYQNNIDPEARYAVNDSQQDLFSNQEMSISKDEFTVTSDGAAYREVPLIITKVLDEKAEKKEKTLPQKVSALYNQGMTVEHIATELSCSISEVQLIIDML